MRYVSAIPGTFLALIIFIITAVLFKGTGNLKDVELFLTVSTFLFAILVGFFTSRLNSRYEKMRELIGSEDALWLSLYKTSQLYGKEFSDKIRNLIDKYYIVSFDFYGLDEDCYKHSMKYFLGVYDELIKMKKHRDEEAFGKMLDRLSSIEDKRNNYSILSLEKITKGQWTVLISLATIIIVNLFYIEITGMYSQAIVVLLSTILILVLLIIRDLQNQRMAGKLLLSESGQKIFETIGRLRYYNEHHIRNGSLKIPKDIKTYRLGLHKPGEEFDIKVVDNC